MPADAGELSVWPASATPLPHGGLAVGGVPLCEIADRFDTPTYVLDEGEVRGRCRTYRAAFPDADVLYAAKAFLSRAVVRWVREEGLGLDVCSAGELELAVTAGFPPERIVLHGNAKSPHDLEAALRLGVGRIVIDSPSEIARIAAAVGPSGRQKVMVRVVPGVSAGGHDKIRTGTEDQKFGLSLTDGGAQHAVARILGQPQLELTGLHCHIGSQITEVKPYLTALRRMIGLMARIRDTHGLVLPELDMGGGHGIAYLPGEPSLELTALARRMRTDLVDGCAAAGTSAPEATAEPREPAVPHGRGHPLSQPMPSPSRSSRCGSAGPTHTAPESWEQSTSGTPASGPGGSPAGLSVSTVPGVAAGSGVDPEQADHSPAPALRAASPACEIFGQCASLGGWSTPSA